MKLSLIVSLFILTLSLNAQTTYNYARIFGADFHKAEKYFGHHKAMFYQRCQQFNVSYPTAISVVFPELIRYNPESDMLETMSNRVFYGNFGGSYGSFSIGCFQMKPLFIEEMERFIELNHTVFPEFRFISEYKTPENDSAEIRKARISRMTKPEWQIVYVCCFLKIMEHRFPRKKDSPEEYQIRFLATAYNRGFLCSAEEIEKWMKIDAFPDGVDSRRKQYNYSDIAYYAYRRLFK